MGVSRTTDKLFEKDDLLYDWLVLFQDRKTILKNSNLSPLMYEVMCRKLSVCDETLDVRKSLAKQFKYCWKTWANKQGSQSLKKPEPPTLQQ